MRFASTIFLLIAVASGAYADPVEPPTSEDVRLISAAIKKELRDPESMELSELLSAAEPTSTNMTWVCGSVRGKNGFGGFAQPSPFVAMIVNDQLTKRRIVQHLRISRDDREADIAIRICREKFEFATAVAEAGQEVADDIKLHSRSHLFCEIEGRPSASCDQLDGAVSRLKEAGWCYRDTLGTNWHKCGGAKQ